MDAANTLIDAGAVAIEAQPQPVIVKRHDAVIASTTHALLVRQDGKVPVYYVPQGDVYMEQLVESPGPLPHVQGRARVYSVTASGGGAENAAWVLLEPPADRAALAGHVGFDPDIFTIKVG